MMGHIAVGYINSLKEFEVYSTIKQKETKEKEIFFDAYHNIGAFDAILHKVQPELVINCIGIVKSRVKEDNKEPITFINSYMPHKLASICKKNNSKLVHISTDCVFSGEQGAYTENSPYSPVDFYGLSKATGEVNDRHNLTIRTSIIGPELNKPSRGLLEWAFAQKGKTIKGFTGAVWSGLTTLELAKQIIEMHKKNVTGLINIASEPITKKDLLELINEIYKLNMHIEPESKFFCDRSMKTLRTDVGYNVPGHKEMLKALKQWMLQH